RRSLRIPPLVRKTVVVTRRGRFAAFTVAPASGVIERQPALLVPGYTGSKEDFLAILEPLAHAGRAVTAIDMRGQYQSQPADNQAGYALDQLGADIVAVADVLSTDERVHLLGHSFGGLVARHAVLAPRAAFGSLTLLGSGPGTIGGVRAQALRDLIDYLEPAGTDIERLGTMISEIWHAQMKPQAQAEGTAAEIIEFLTERTLLTCPLGLAEMAKHLLNCPDRTA